MANYTVLNNTQKRNCIANQISESRGRIGDLKRDINDYVNNIDDIIRATAILSDKLSNALVTLEREYGILEELKIEVASLPVQQDAAYTIRRGLTPASPAGAHITPVNAQPLRTENLTGQQIVSALTNTIRMRTPDGREIFAQVQQNPVNPNMGTVLATEALSREDVEAALNDDDGDCDEEPWEDIDCSDDETTMTQLSDNVYECDACGGRVITHGAEGITEYDLCPNCHRTVVDL